MIKLEQLQQFLVVCQCSSLMDAAEQLHRTPSAVSMTLKHIEQDLGGPLFEGDRKRQLTPLGQYTRDRAQRSVDEHRRALEDIHRYARGDTGLVRIAAVPSAATQQLPDAIARCRAGGAQLRIDLRDTNSDAVHAAVLSGAVDLGVASLPNSGSSLHRQLLRSDHFVCVCAAQHPLANGTSPLPWSALRQHNFIHNGLCEQIEHPAVRELSASAELQVYNIASLLAFVRRDLGITVLPVCSITDTRGLVTLPLRDSKAQRSLYLLRHADYSPAPAVKELEAAIIAGYKEGLE